MENLTVKDVAARLGITPSEAYGFVQACLALNLADISGRQQKVEQVEEVDAKGIKHLVWRAVRGKPTTMYRFFAGVGAAFTHALKQAPASTEASEGEPSEAAPTGQTEAA